MKEPKVFCPKCGEKTTVIEWFEYEPGKGLGYAECPECGTLDFKIRNSLAKYAGLILPLPRIIKCQRDNFSGNRLSQPARTFFPIP